MGHHQLNTDAKTPSSESLARSGALNSRGMRILAIYRKAHSRLRAAHRRHWAKRSELETVYAPVKYYAVAIGRSPGVFLNRKAAIRETEGFPGGKYHSFYDFDKAKQYSQDGPKYASASLMDVEDAKSGSSAMDVSAVAPWCSTM